MEQFEFKNLEDTKEKLTDEFLRGSGKYSSWPGIEGLVTGQNPNTEDNSNTTGLIIILSKPLKDLPTCVVTQEGIFPIYSLLISKFRAY